MTAAVETHGLTKRYGKRTALDGLDLAVPERVVFGYLGPNGAGKTTTIRLLAGLLRPTSGRAAIFGIDVGDDRERAQREIGYLPGAFVPYLDLTGERYLRYLGRLRRGVDWSVVTGLADRFGVDLRVRAGALSHGNRQKLGLIQAFMHEPELVILDEPTSGLDPLAQREFLSLVRETREAGATVFLSSHIMSEVEAVADVVGILRHGQLIVVREVDKLKAQARRRIDLAFTGDPPARSLRTVPGVQELSVDGRTAHLVVEGSTAELLRVAAPYGIEGVVTREPDLEDIFMAYYQAREAKDGEHDAAA